MNPDYQNSQRENDARGGKPRWLIAIQDNSWEPELFISGGAIFTLLQIPDFLNRQSLILEQETGFIESILIAHFLLVAVHALTIGFISHLLLRGYWIGMVCLSYVFPKGILHENIDYAPRFKEKVSRFPGIVDFVILLEKACSIVFALSFIFFLAAMGVLITLLVIIPHSGLEEQLGTTLFLVLRSFSGFGLFLGAIYMIDFLTLGKVKRIRWLVPLYYPIYRLFSILSLAFIYRGPYYTLITNVKPKHAFITVTVWIGAALAITAIVSPRALEINKNDPRFFINFSDQRNVHLLKWYDDVREENDLIESISIPSEIINDRFLKVFVVHHKLLEPAILQHCGKASEASLSDGQKLKCIDEFYQLTIDEQKVNGLKWRNYTHPKTGESGIISFVPIKQLEEGEHEITLRLLLSMENTKDFYRLQAYGFTKEPYAQFRFWKNY